jgi:hypothetical protein
MTGSKTDNGESTTTTGAKGESTTATGAKGESTTATGALPNKDATVAKKEEEILTDLTIESTIQGGATADMSKQLDICHALKNATCIDVGKTFETYELIHENKEDNRLKDKDEISARGKVYKEQAHRLVSKRIMTDAVEKCALSKDCETFKACMTKKADVLTKYKARKKELFEADVRDAAEDHIMQLASNCMKNKPDDTTQWKDECKKIVEDRKKLVCLTEDYEDTFYRGAKSEMNSLSKCSVEDRDNCIKEIFRKAGERNPEALKKGEKWAYIRFGAQADTVDVMVDKIQSGATDAQVLTACRDNCKKLRFCEDFERTDKTDETAGKEGKPLCERLKRLAEIRAEGGPEAKLKIIKHPTIDIDIEARTATSVTEVSQALQKAHEPSSTSPATDKVAGERAVDYVDHTNVEKLAPSRSFGNNVVSTHQVKTFEDKDMDKAIQKVRTALSSAGIVTKRRILANDGDDSKGIYASQTKTQGSGKEKDPVPWWKRLMEGWTAVGIAFMCVLAVIILIVIVRKRRKRNLAKKEATANETKIIPVVAAEIADDFFNVDPAPKRRMSREERKSLPLMRPPPNPKYTNQMPQQTINNRPQVVVGNSADGW